MQRLLCPWNSLGKNTGVGCHPLLQGICPTQGSNSGLLHYRQILLLSEPQGSPRLLRCLLKVTSLIIKTLLSSSLRRRTIKKSPKGFQEVCSEDEESACKTEDTGDMDGFTPWVGKIPWRRKWQPIPVFLPRNSQERRNLMGYNPKGRKESDATEQQHRQTEVKNGQDQIYIWAV